ncbi:YecH family metal-binding protein [Spongorhabdus nitratireducens]
MSRSNHGRKVLEIVREAEQALSREMLLQEMNNRFGEGAEFHTCSAQGMTGEELVELFLGKGKLQQGEQGLFIGGCGCGSH